MNNRLFIGYALAGAMALQVLAQNPSPSPVPQTPSQQDEVVKITTNLVQIDVTVVDDNGNAVTDLKP